MQEYKSNLEEFTLVKKKTDIKRVKITKSSDAAEYINQFYGSDIEFMESFFLLLLNNSNNTIGYVKISQGGITGTVVDVRILAKYCISSLAVGCILAHNHPSGTLRPSSQDISLTNKIVKGLELLDVKVLDHIIVTPEEGKYFSFKDDGLI